MIRNRTGVIASTLARSLESSWNQTLRALAISKGIDRDRAVDESGNQLAVFGRRGARPFNREETQRMYLRNGQLYTVSDEPQEHQAEQKPEPWTDWLSRAQALRAKIF